MIASKMKMFFVFVTVLFFVLISVSTFAYSQTTNTDPGEMMGFVYAKDMKTPVKNVQIVLTEVKDKKDKSERKTFRSDLTGEKGDYKIENIDPGTYMISIKIRNQLYKIKKVSFIVKIFSNKSSFISFSLRKKSLPPIAWIITGTAICRVVSKYEPPKEASATTR